MHRDEARRVVEGYLAGHGAEWLSEDVAFHDMTQPEPMRGRAQATAFLARFYGEIFSEVRIADVLLTAAEARVVAEWTFHGRHTGSLLGETPTGNAVQLPMACSYEVASGEITAARLYYDTASLLRQIGAGAVPAVA